MNKLLSEKKIGFTLIELLAVIVVLAVIAMITTPIVVGIIEDAKERANRRSIDGLVRAGEYYLAQSTYDDIKKQDIDGEQNILHKIIYDGKTPESGQLVVNGNGKVALAIQYGDKCYRKQYNGKIETINYTERSCRVNVHIDRPLITIEVPTGTFNEAGWARDNFTITMTGTDFSELGISEILWCGSAGETCVPSAKYKGGVMHLQVSQETPGMTVCAKALDGFGNESETVCSEQYKLDKTAPTFIGLENMTISSENPGDFLTGVSADDNLSGIQGTFTYTPQELDLTTAGNYEVEYQATDLAGNIGKEIRQVRIETPLPQVTFTPSANSINERGWAKAPFYVQISGVDHSKLGIKEIHWCGTSANVCEPSSSASEALNAYIQREGSTILCAYAVDNFDQRGETVCSDAYKLDQTIPELSGIADITVDTNTVVDLTGGVAATDTLSGIMGSYSYNPTNVDTSKAGETIITYRVEDNAGNVKEITRKVIVRAGKPTVTYQLSNPVDVNSNGWAKSNFFVTVVATDYSGHGLEKIVWCGTTDNTCTPVNEVAGASTNVQISMESSNNRICSYAVDKYGQQGATTCSDGYKLDKTAPTFTGVTNISVAKGGTVNLTSGVSATDSLSLVSGSYSYSPTSVSTSTAKVVTVTYQATDLAGNVGTASRTVTVTAPKPTVSFSIPGGTMNSNNWARSNFYVTVRGTDNSGLGIKEIRWCGTTGSSCTPSSVTGGSSASALVQTESRTNKVCAYAIDNYGQVGATTCSSNYQLDKTAPNAFNISTSNVTGSSFNVRGTSSDGLSGIANYTLYLNSAYKSQNTSGSFTATGLSSGTTYRVYIKVTDQAGNTRNSNTVSQQAITTYIWSKYNVNESIDYIQVGRGSNTGWHTYIPISTDFRYNSSTGKMEPAGSYKYINEYRRSDYNNGYIYLFDTLETKTGLVKITSYYGSTSNGDYFNYQTFEPQVAYSRGSYIGTVSSTNSGAYPSNGRSGSYWYVRQ